MPLNREIVEIIKSQENQKRVTSDFDRFQVYNGRLKEVIKKAISREFSRPETINELINRIIPINITQKIINKLAMVYMMPPQRSAMDGNPGDEELLNLYETPLKINMSGKIANRFVKLFKHTAWEPFLDSKGVPRLRTLPSHTYTPISTDPREPHKPTIFVKHLKMDIMPENQRFAVWTDENFFIMDGGGSIVQSEMNALENPEGINPFGRIPFTYIAEQDELSLIPISDDDLITMQIAICILLTDLAFASKYQLWSIFVLTGSEGSQKVDMNPNSVIQLAEGMDLKTIRPETDIDKALQFIETLISLLLTTKNLSVGDISGMVKSEGVSGVAKMIDRSETTEDRKDQQAMFVDGEKRFWDLYAHWILPHWVKTGKIDKEFVGQFSKDFELSIKFADPKPFIGDVETVKVEREKLDPSLPLTTMERALKTIHSDLDAAQVEELKEQIIKEKNQRIQNAQRILDGAEIDAESE